MTPEAARHARAAVDWLLTHGQGAETTVELSPAGLADGQHLRITVRAFVPTAALDEYPQLDAAAPQLTARQEGTHP